jgi:beta-aspartyl-peptidase (threonine type)
MKALAIHGGAGALPRSQMTEEKAREFHQALKYVLDVGNQCLVKGIASLDAVEASVVALEDIPLFNAGRGSSFNREGKIEMEAAIMDGATLRAGASSLLRNVRNPVKLARLIMEKTPHVLLASESAEAFARSQGLVMERDEYFFTAYRYEAMLKMRGTEKTALSEDVVVPAALHSFTMSTVGAVACDDAGNLAAASSSGGTTNKYAGRVGQSCVVGAGAYANNKTCAVSCTGQGEAFMRGVTAFDLSAQMEYKGITLADAARSVIHEKLPGSGGLVAVDSQGDIAMQYNTQGMYRGWITKEGRFFTAIYDTCYEWSLDGKVINSDFKDVLASRP